MRIPDPPNAIDVGSETPHGIVSPARDDLRRVLIRDQNAATGCASCTVGLRRSPDIWFDAMDADVPPRPDVSRRENEVLRLPEEMTTRELARS